MLNPWRIHQDRLPSNRIHILILHSTQEPRSKTRAHDNRRWRLDAVGLRDDVLLLFVAEEREYARFCNFGDVLYGASDDSAAFGEEAGGEVGEVNGHVEADCAEDFAIYRLDLLQCSEFVGREGAELGGR